MTMYRKKPVEVEARQWDGSALGAGPVINWILDGDSTATYHEHLMDGDFIAHPDPFLRIQTLEGVIIAKTGDWIIRGVKGEFYLRKPDIFAETYDEVPVSRDADFWRDSWSGKTIRVGDSVESWWGRRTRGTVTRIFQPKKGTRWQIEWDGPDLGTKRMYASDFELATA